MPRRNLIPFALLAVLAVATLGFAVLGASSAPGAATLTVQNASTETFGSPTGSTSFAMDVVSTLSAGTGSGTITQARLVAFVPPQHMAVYQVTGRSTRLLAVLDQSAVTCALSAYTSIVGGTTPWTAAGQHLHEDRDARRLLRPGAEHDGAIVLTTAHRGAAGSVTEIAVVRSGYLISVRLTVVVPPQKLSNGTEAAHGAESEALVLLRINGTPTRDYGP